MSTQQQQSGTLQQLFSKNLTKIKSVLPKHLTPERLLRIALLETSKAPKLLQCSQESVLSCVLQCAQLGLEPGGALGHAYLIPYDKSIKNGNQWSKISECQFQIGYKGMLDLARRSKQIVSIMAQVVRENDMFEFEYGIEEKLRHVPASGERGEIIYVYAVAKLVGGGYQFEVMTKHDVDIIRNSSKAYASSKDKTDTIWGKHYDEMARKTAIRRLFKYLPMSIEMARAVELDEASDREEQRDFIDGDFNFVPEQRLSQSDKTAVALEKKQTVIIPKNVGTVLEETVNQTTGEVVQKAAVTLSGVLEAVQICLNIEELNQVKQLVNQLSGHDAQAAVKACIAREKELSEEKADDWEDFKSGTL